MTKRHFTLMPSAALCLGLAMACSSKNSEDLLPEPTLSGDAKITILQTTDVHHTANGQGHVTAAAPADLGSYPRIAAYVNCVRANAGNPVVLVDSGDWSTGTLYDLTLGQQPAALYFMDTLHYNCATIGNHEFDYTPLGLKTMLTSAQANSNFRTPMVASNLQLNGNTDLAPFVGEGKTLKPSWTETLPNGVKVGYIGLLGKAAASSAPASAPVTFRDFSTSYTFVQDLVNDLRNNQNCHVVVALSHTGADANASAGEDVDLAKHVTGIDVIASGHNHNGLSSAVTVANDGWNTKIVCAGAYGTNVARIDLTYHPTTKNTTVDASSNLPMTEATMIVCGYPASGDPDSSHIVEATDAQLNAGLSPLFTQVFPDYSAANASTGLYHAVGGAAQPMESNEKNLIQCPNGMGNLCADAVRSVPNGIIAKALLAAGWNGSPTDPNLPASMAALAASGFDPTFVQVGVVPTGVIRNILPPGVALNFADIYNTLPLGFSPDQTQAIPVGYPLVSAYLELGDLKKLCALQLVSQTGLAGTEYYLNLSGIGYSLKVAESITYFKYATAATVLNMTSQKAAAGSTIALQAMGALSTLGSDGGAALLAAMDTNPYAKAMVELNEPAQIATNLGVLGAVAVAAESGQLNGLIVAQAIAAIDVVSGFGAADPACTSAASALADARHRVAADLYAVLMMGAAQAQFGVSITAYQASTGSTTLSSADMPTLLGNRFDLDPATAGVQETKEWMALLLYLVTPPDQGGHFTSGTITGEYLSTPLFADFGSFGPAVQLRNASYPVAQVGQHLTTMGTLQAAP